MKGRIRAPAVLPTFKVSPISAEWEAAFTPKKYSWYSFLLEAESTPEP